METRARSAVGIIEVRIPVSSHPTNEQVRIECPNCGPSEDDTQLRLGLLVFPALHSERLSSKTALIKQPKDLSQRRSGQNGQHPTAIDGHHALKHARRGIFAFYRTTLTAHYPLTCKTANSNAGHQRFAAASHVAGRAILVQHEGFTRDGCGALSARLLLKFNSVYRQPIAGRSLVFAFRQVQATRSG